MPANHSNTNCVITILIHSDKRIFKTFLLCCYVALLRTWRRPCFHGINTIILMPQIFDVIANENAHYKRNELELDLQTGKISPCLHTFWAWTSEVRSFASSCFSPSISACSLCLWPSACEEFCIVFGPCVDSFTYLLRLNKWGAEFCLLLF